VLVDGRELITLEFSPDAVQWDPGDFAPIADALDTMFRRLDAMRLAADLELSRSGDGLVQLLVEDGRT
jgi:hypothetical protein